VRRLIWDDFQPGKAVSKWAISNRGANRLNALTWQRGGGSWRPQSSAKVFDLPVRDGSSHWRLLANDGFTPKRTLSRLQKLAVQPAEEARDETP
jgi:hypothetical protein